MAWKTFIKSCFKITIAAAGLLLTFIAVTQIMLFLSDPGYSTRAVSMQKKNAWTSLSWSLFINTCLLSCFILQHSVLALPAVKKLFNRFGFQVLHRSVYVISTAFVLQNITEHWQEVVEVSLWHLNVNNKIFWWSFVSIHAVAWTMIYVGTICMDVNELLGIKQVYYDVRNLPDPTTYKSHELKRLYEHMRHPSFVAFLIIFWVIPIMSLDRLLLAAILTVYMYLAWNTDQTDYRYQERQYFRKVYELNNFN